jgi:hypothetical protein
MVDAAREAPTRGALIVISRYLSEGTRARLQEADIGYVDLTGNVRVVVIRPGLFIQTQGATEDPDRDASSALSSTAACRLA